MYSAFSFCYSCHYDLSGCITALHVHCMSNFDSFYSQIVFFFLFLMFCADKVHVN